MKKALLTATLLMFTAGALYAQSVPKKAPCNPMLTVQGADQVRQGEAATFYADLQGVPDGVAPTYRWSVSNGEIEAGQGTPAITLSKSGLKAGETVTATLEVGALPEECGSVSSSSTTTVTAPDPKARGRRSR